MKSARKTIALTMAAVVVVAVVFAVVASALTEEEAAKEFEARKCTACHNNNIAPDFKGTIEVLRVWATKYGSLDEAVSAEAPNFKMFNDAKSWDELMGKMPGITPELKEFFEKVFEEAKSGAPQPAEETTTTTTPPAEEKEEQPTVTTVAQPQQPAIRPPKPKVEIKTLPKVEVPDPVREAENLVVTGLPVGLAVYLAATGLLIIAYTITRRG